MSDARKVLDIYHASEKQIWEIAEDVLLVEISINSLYGALHAPNIWDTDTNDECSVLDLIHNPGLSSKHVEKIQKADIKYAITSVENQYDVLDGFHRVASIITGYPDVRNISAKLINVDQIHHYFNIAQA